MTFEQCIERVLMWEAGYNHHAQDPGGETNFGITKKFYPHLDIKNLTRAQAIEIYRKDYWDKNKLEKIPVYLRLAFFDAVVNQGPGGAVKALQRALRFKGRDVDMVFGPKTEEALMKAGVGIVVRFLAERMTLYTENTTWPVFGKGWTARIMDIAVETGKGMGDYGKILA